MPGKALEERVDELERKVQLLLERGEPEEEAAPWWRRIVGTFADDPEFEEAMRLGREYRQSLRPPDGGGSPG